MTEQIVIAGAGHAAGQVVASLKQKKFAGNIVVIGDEAWLPYQRPPLSKKFLAGEMPAERLYFKPPSFYDDPNIDVRLNDSVVSIDRRSRTVTTRNGGDVSYDSLVLAIGSRVRRVETEGADLEGVHYLRSIDDVDAIRADLDQAQHVVIVGAGYIGLEVAAVARQLGNDVTVLEMADRVMSRVVSPEVSAFYQDQHSAHGVELLLSTGLASIVGDGRVSAVMTSDGHRIPADAVIVGVGILPNTELAAEAGLDVDNGIVVDAHCRTSDDRIYAVGDCTSHPNAIYDRQLRLESVHNALEQAKTAASNICGDEIEYSQVPWFWSDQYDIKLQIAGLSDGFDEVVMRGDPATNSFACMYLKGGRLIACDAVNSPRDFMQSKNLIAQRCEPDKTKLADADVQLKELV